MSNRSGKLKEEYNHLVDSLDTFKRRLDTLSKEFMSDEGYFCGDEDDFWENKGSIRTTRSTIEHYEKKVAKMEEDYPEYLI